MLQFKIKKLKKNICMALIEWFKYIYLYAYDKCRQTNMYIEKTNAENGNFFLYGQRMKQTSYAKM